MLDIKKRYIFYTIATCVFGIIYELFSHNVYTPYMYLAFLIPLIGYILLRFISFDKLSIEFLNIAVLSLTLGSIFKGVLYIYGTTNKLSIIYLYIGLIALLILIIYKAFQKIKSI